MAELTYPNRANTGGFPLLECVANVVGDNLIFTFQPHAALGANWTGGFYVKVANAIAETAVTTEPVVFATQGVTGNMPLYFYNGDAVTGADVVTTGNGVMLCFYDAASRRLQLLSVT